MNGHAEKQTAYRGLFSKTHNLVGRQPETQRRTDLPGFRKIKVLYLSACP